MKHTVEGQSALPTDAGHYARCSSDHTIMIHGKTGDSYVKADGQPWVEDGFVKDGDGYRRGHAKEN